MWELYIMTKRKSLLENILILGCVVFTAAAIVVGLILFLIQPAELCSLFTSVHTVGLFGFAAGTVIACIITAYVLQKQFSKQLESKSNQFSKKIESKNRIIRKLISEKKLLEQTIQQMSLAEEATPLVNTPRSKPKNIISEIEDLSDKAPPAVAAPSEGVTQEGTTPKTGPATTTQVESSDNS